MRTGSVAAGGSHLGLRKVERLSFFRDESSGGGVQYLGILIQTDSKIVKI